MQRKLLTKWYQKENFVKINIVFLKSNFTLILSVKLEKIIKQFYPRILHCISLKI